MVVPVLVALGQASAQPPQRPASDDPFAEELNPFPKPPSEKARTAPKGRTDPKPRSETKPRGSANRPAENADDGGDDAPQLPMPFPEATEPAQRAPRRPGRVEGGGGAPAGRPTARPMAPNLDLLPFPDIDMSDSDEDSPARQAEYANAADSYQAALRINPKHQGARRNLEAIRSRGVLGRRAVRAQTSGLQSQPELVPAGRPTTRPAGA